MKTHPLLDVVALPIIRTVHKKFALMRYGYHEMIGDYVWFDETEGPHPALNYYTGPFGVLKLISEATEAHSSLGTFVHNKDEFRDEWQFRPREGAREELLEELWVSLREVNKKMLAGVSVVCQ